MLGEALTATIREIAQRCYAGINCARDVERGFLIVGSYTLHNLGQIVDRVSGPAKCASGAKYLFDARDHFVMFQQIATTCRSSSLLHCLEKAIVVLQHTVNCFFNHLNGVFPGPCGDFL